VGRNKEKEGKGSRGEGNDHFSSGYKFSVVKKKLEDTVSWGRKKKESQT